MFQICLLRYIVCQNGSLISKRRITVLENKAWIYIRIDSNLNTNMWCAQILLLPKLHCQCFWKPYMQWG